MSGGWAAKAPHISARAVARLPRFAEVVVCETEDAIWLQGKALSDDLERLLALIPGSRCFSVLPDKQLIPRGKLIPRGRLPEGPWQLLADWLDQSLAAPEIASAVSDCPAVAERVRLQVVASDKERSSLLLETKLSVFCDYVTTAPQWRIDRWIFAASAEGTVLVQGRPLPPLPGQQWTCDEGICVPAGCAWEPAIDARTVRDLLGLEKEDLAVVRADGIWERIAGDAWVKCSRSAVRITAEVLA